MISHGQVRSWVMGHERCNLADKPGGPLSHPLTLEEKQACADCVREGIAAGAYVHQQYPPQLDFQDVSHRLDYLRFQHRLLHQPLRRPPRHLRRAFLYKNDDLPIKTTV